MSFFQITLHRSAIGLPKRTRDALAALGLRHRQQTVVHPVSATVAGLVFRVKELVRVSEVAAPSAEAVSSHAATVSASAPASTAASASTPYTTRDARATIVAQLKDARRPPPGFRIERRYREGGSSRIGFEQGVGSTEP